LLPPRTSWRRSLPVLFRRGLVLASIFLVCDAAWIARNYRIFGKIVPLQYNTLGGYHYTSSQLAFFRWLSALGEKPQAQPDTFIAWFWPRTGFSSQGFVVPSHIPTSRCSLDDIKRARDLYDGQYDARPAVSEAADRDATQIIDRCAQSFREEKPLYYHLVAPVKLVGVLLVHSGPTLPLPPFAQTLRRPDLLVLKLFGVGSYWFILVTALGGLWLALRRKDALWLAIAAPFPWIVLFFCFLFRRPEAHRLTVAYPGLCMLTVLCLVTIWGWWQARRPRPVRAQVPEEAAVTA
jgi:hypothetical protein